MSNKKTKTKVLSAVTVSDSVIFFYGIPTFLSNKGFEVAIASSKGAELDLISNRENPVIFPVEMEREIKLFSDFISLLKVIIVIYRFRPDIVNSGTPKAGLLYTLAAWFLRVPVRIYHVRGLRHESLTGFSEKLQIAIERIVGRLATHVICETESLKNLALTQNLFDVEKCYVLGPGSSGVQLENFNPEKFSSDFRSELRSSMGIPEDSIVIGLVGRLVPRKGISELIESWKEIRRNYPSAILLLVGPIESAQSLESSDISTIQNDSRIISTGMVSDVAKYYSIMDVFTLPAHWEGFGNVLVEAASMGVPVVTTNGTGTIDAAKDGYNAKIIDVKDTVALTKAISEYLDDPSLRYKHGKNGQEWATKFDRKKILRHLYEFYQSINF